MPSSRSLIAFALAFAVSTAHAMDLPTLVTRADTAAGATVYLVPPMAVFRSSLDETHMQSAACRFSTTDPDAVRALVALLQSNELHDNAVYQRPDLREGVYLTLADGMQLKVLLQDNPGSRLPVSGVAETSIGGNLQSVAVSARQSLATDVREWAMTRGGVRTGSACDRLVPASVAPDTRIP
jgi:hypothetical protein